MCQLAIDILEDYNILPKLGYFVMDNATTNDTFMQSMEEYLSTVGFEFYTAELYLKCLDHIINIAVKTFLFGSSETVIQDENYIPGTEEAMVEI